VNDDAAPQVRPPGTGPREDDQPPEVSWLNRNIFGLGLTSFFSDVGHEAATSVLPMFIQAIGAPPVALGVIEGIADAVSSFAKLGAGWYGDRVTRRKPLVVSGYVLTAVGVGAFALATNWVMICIARATAWFGRGARGPLRDTIIKESVPASAYGRAFGFERAGDSLGAVLGPGLALALLALLGSNQPLVFKYRTIFLISLVPGLLAALSFGTLVTERARAGVVRRKFFTAVGALPGTFKLFLVAVGIFGVGDFAHTLLILRAVQLLTPLHSVAFANRTAIIFYIVHNVVYTALSYPIGAAGDRTDKMKLLAGGYLMAALMAIGFMTTISSIWYLGLLFVLGGAFLAVQDTLERAIGAQLLPAESASMGFGVLATVNGVGDFVSSFVVGLLWTRLSPAAGFAYAAILTGCGALLMFALPLSRRMRA
jgi:MFS family permease